ncbi:MAG: helix-turn-helix domain-containing protein [Phaeodactylibacter xiamenensis]|uniref:helix-turn-helix domain-containing protein n=1 Tax=Phaeodactylibacter xiamenensis TaxID=1524460 RepID=UPI000695E49F|nr:XRE family transcriptional regulator [Phaeodactylibacter xiamenensis]MCR9053850.1 XRE family transcriptional regulator [bacterium]
MHSAFPKRLKAARLQAGATQAILAAAIGVSKQAVSQFEHGRKSPESNTLIRIAQFLGKPVGYFMRPLSIQLEQVDFRKRASLKGKALEAVKAKVLDHLEPYLELEEILGIGIGFTNPIADIQITQIENAEEAACRLMEAWKLGNNPIPNIVEMLEEHNIKVVMVDADRQFDGLSTMVNGRIPVIVVNRNWDTLRVRFTVLHELGHLVLQFPKEAGHQFCEKACNRFAGAMLLPAEVFQEEIGLNRKRVALSELIPIKEYYGLSLAAMIYRGSELGIFTRGVANRFWKMRNQNPELKKENPAQFGHYLGQERSSRFEQLLAKALTLELVTYSKAAQMAGKSLNDLRKEHQLV